jgi:tetratricopeptide (TPR) repeat protein
VREAYALGRNVTRLFGELTVLGAVPAEMVAAKFANSHFGANWPGAPLLWWTAHRDTAEIKRVIRETQAVGAGAEPGLANRARFVHAWAEASLALARGDSAEGERRFRVLPDSLMPLATFSWLARAQLLEARGRAREALPFAEASMLIPAPPLQGLFVLEAARLHERLGDRIEALADYRYVADVWRNADLELKPYVDDARAALKRLGGERRP